MKFSELVETYEEIEATTKRLEMTDYLVELFRRTPKELLDKVVYLTQGKLYPDFIDLEMGIAEKMAVRAISMAFGVGREKVERELKERGDLGLVAEHLAKEKVQATLLTVPLKVGEAYELMDKIARASGPGSQEQKMKLLSGLLSDASPKEAKYILRMVTGRLRLGVADMTILDALAASFGEGNRREEIERAYNMTSDMGNVAKTLAREGFEGLEMYGVKVGRPIRMMMAQRLSTTEEVLEKLGGRAACEWKYDGERMQIHKLGSRINIFTRRLEDITEQYPDVEAEARERIKAEEAVVEGEAVAYDPETGDLLPFQQLMHRRRKYGVRDAAKKYPVNLFLFDALYIDGEDLTQRDYKERRAALRDVIEEEDNFRLAEYLVTGKPEKVREFFEEAIAAGCEGLILKAEKGAYQAGARGWLWIKLKRSYQSKMVEPIDVVVVGAFSGRGRRSGTYGALLTAAYDKERDTFATVCRVGSGFTDEQLEKLPEKLSPYKIDHPHPRVESALEADFWFSPEVVMEVIGDELTLSPQHTTGKGEIREEAGLAVRFPRFTGKWRPDKRAEDATTVKEIVQMYRAQLKRVGKK